MTEPLVTIDLTEPFNRGIPTPDVLALLDQITDIEGPGVEVAVREIRNGSGRSIGTEIDVTAETWATIRCAYRDR